MIQCSRDDASGQFRTVWQLSQTETPYILYGPDVYERISDSLDNRRRPENGGVRSARKNGTGALVQTNLNQINLRMQRDGNSIALDSILTKTLSKVKLGVILAALFTRIRRFDINKQRWNDQIDRLSVCALCFYRALFILLIDFEENQKAHRDMRN